MASVVFEQTPHAMIALFGDGAIVDEEWDDFVAMIRAGLAAGHPARALVLSEGAAPAPAQRAKLDAALAPARLQLKAAIVTGSTFVRGVVNAFALVNPGYRAFAPDHLDAALAYLDIRPTGAQEVHAAVMRLQIRIRTPSAIKRSR